LITTTSKSLTVAPKPYNFQSTKGFTNVEWKALHEIEEKHAEEFKHLMNRALNPFLCSDKEIESHSPSSESPTIEQTRSAHTQWFKDYASLISKTIDEHNVQSSVTEHIKNKEQKMNCGRSYWSMSYNKTAKTLQAMKNALDLLSRWKHKAKLGPLLQRIITDLPNSTQTLTQKMMVEQDSTDLYNKIKTLRKEIATPLQKRQREKQYNISKTIKEEIQTLEPMGKNLKNY
jgi:hypothetical protein